MKKLLALLLALLMSAFILISCGPEEGPDNDDPPANDGGDVQPLPNGSDNAAPDGEWDLL